MRIKHMFKKTVRDIRGEEQENTPEVPDNLMRKCNACKAAVFARTRSSSARATTARRAARPTASTRAIVSASASMCRRDRTTSSAWPSTPSRTPSSTPTPPRWRGRRSTSSASTPTAASPRASRACSAAACCAMPSSPRSSTMRRMAVS